MTAIGFGLLTAVIWASTLLGSSRSARLIGPWSTLAWVMLIGIVLTVPLLLTTQPVAFSTESIVYLALAGFANCAALVFVYTALQRGKVALVGPIVSTQGAIGTVLALLAGDPLAAGAMAALAVIAVGVVMAATERRADGAVVPAQGRSGTAPTVGLALAGAMLFGLNIFAIGRIADTLPLAWAVLPARLAGVVVVTIPLLATRRARLTRPAVPFVVLVGIAEVAGTLSLAAGSRESAPVTSMLASQSAAIAVVAGFLLFGERLTRLQVAGVVLIVVGVTALAALTAG